MDSVFGPLAFDEGWYTNQTIRLFQKEYPVSVCAQAYYEEDGLTREQKAALSDYQEHEDETRKTVEKLLCGQYGQTCSGRFIPRTILFERDGSYTLLCDDNDAPEEGIAVLIKPVQTVVSQNDYL